MSVPTRRALPPYPQTQARSSTTFRPPPIDGSLTLPELFDWHGRHSPDHKLFVFANEDGSIRSIYWPEAVRAIHTGAKMIRDRMHWKPGMAETPVVGILATSDSIPYSTLTMGIVRANYTAFLISVRNSPAAVAHLLYKVGVKHLIVGRDPAMQDLANEALDIYKKEHSSVSVPETSHMPVFEELYFPSSEGSAVSEDLPFEYKGPDTPTIILHSSGSTAFPKPIVFTHHRLLEIILSPCFGERDLADHVFSLHTTPMYHVMGILMSMWAVSSGVIIAFFPPKSPAPIPTPDTVFEAIKATNSDYVVAVPAMVEAWSRNPDYVKWLATRQGISYGGGPLNKEVGDYMVSQGSNIFNLYGATESGAASVFLPAHVGQDWEYFKFAGNLTAKMLPSGDGAFEYVMVANEFSHPAVVNTKIDGIDAFSSSDLLAPHPTKPGFWKIIGRTDDQIMHSTGEKTNPGPLENMMNQDPHVAACVMFGRGRFQAGIVVEPKPEYQFDPSDEAKLAEFRNKIWPTVEKMNEYAPQHSRLFKEMIMVAKPSKPFSYTAKRTVRRGAVLKEYDEEINALYDTVAASAESNVPPPSQWDVPSTTDFVRAVVRKIMTHPVTDDDDLFQHGCDSLQATYIRNAILHTLRESAKVDTRKVAGSFVYDCPSISRLAAFVSSLALGTHESADVGQSAAARIAAMHAMLAKYTADFPARPAGSSVTKPSGDVVVVTGTTGSLGSHLLAQLAAKPDVLRVYAMNRSSRNQMPLRERQRSTLVDRGLDASILDSGKVVLLEGDLTKPNWGLSESTYNKVHNSTTHIIHNAWRVDFVINLESFKHSIEGVRRLVDFALTSPLPEPPRVLFTSSIGVFQNSPCDEVFEETPLQPDLAVGTGYAEAKWVSEEILYAAAAKTPVDTLVVRVGQVCGGLDGAWNAHEWFPTLVQSGPKLGCFPDESKGVNWIPLEITAGAVIDFRKASNATHIVHLVHPRPVSWHSLAVAASKELSVPLVSFADWLAKLEQIAAAVSQNSYERGAQGDREGQMVRSLRALHLLPYFRGMAEKQSGRMAMGLPDLSVKQALAGSPTLADPNIRQLGEEDVKRWIAYWRKVGVFSDA